MNRFEQLIEDVKSCLVNRFVEKENVKSGYSDLDLSVCLYVIDKNRDKIKQVSSDEDAMLECFIDMANGAIMGIKRLQNIRKSVWAELQAEYNSDLKLSEDNIDAWKTQAARLLVFVFGKGYEIGIDDADLLENYIEATPTEYANEEWSASV